MAYKVVNLDDNILNLRNKVNVVSQFAGDSALLVTDAQSSLVSAVNEIEAVFDASTGKIKSTNLNIDNTGNLVLDASTGIIDFKDDSTSRATFDVSSSSLVLTSTDITLDASGDVVLDADGADVVLKDGGSTLVTFNLDGPDMTTAGAYSFVIGGAATVDATANINLDAGGGSVVLKDDGTQFGSLTNTAGDLIIKSGSTTAATFSGANVTFAGTITSIALDTTAQTHGAAINELHTQIDLLDSDKNILNARVINVYDSAGTLLNPAS